MLSCTSALCRAVPAPRLRSGASRACPQLLPPRARAQPGTCSFLRSACGGSFKCLSPRSHFIVKILTAGPRPRHREPLPVVCSAQRCEQMTVPCVRALQRPTSPLMKARQCKHNSRNMKRSGDSEGEKRRKVLIAFFSVSSGIFLSPVARWISNAPCGMPLAAFRRLASRECQRIPHLASFLYCVFHFFPPNCHNEDVQLHYEKDNGAFFFFGFCFFLPTTLNTLLSLDNK